MGVGAGLYMCDVVVKSSRSLSHLLMSSCHNTEHVVIVIDRARVADDNRPAAVNTFILSHCVVKSMLELFAFFF